MSEYTPEQLGRVLYEMGKDDTWNCAICPVRDNCLTNEWPCLDFAGLLRAVNGEAGGCR
ncbi:MAG: hypothetical protein Q7O66_16595 [Dehalococcoidia bacterium]|nr:hypothetical protein [Dehalococcoidia bacterium]